MDRVDRNKNRYEHVYRKEEKTVYSIINYIEKFDLQTLALHFINIFLYKTNIFEVLIWKILLVCNNVGSQLFGGSVL